MGRCSLRAKVLHPWDLRLYQPSQQKRLCRHCRRQGWLRFLSSRAKGGRGVLSGRCRVTPDHQPWQTQTENIVHWFRSMVLSQWPVSPTFYLSCQTGTVPYGPDTNKFVHHKKGASRAWEVGVVRDHRTSAKPQPSRSQVLCKGILWIITQRDLKVTVYFLTRTP